MRQKDFDMRGGVTDLISLILGVVDGAVRSGRELKSIYTPRFLSTDNTLFHELQIYHLCNSP